MATVSKTQKKHIMISKDRLSEELLTIFSEQYPSKDDIERNIIRIDKPDGTFVCCVPMETDEVSYLVKIKVLVDKNPEESLDREEEFNGDDSQGETIEGADQIPDTEDDSDDE